MSRSLDFLVFCSVVGARHPRGDWQAGLTSLADRVIEFLTGENADPILRRTRAGATIVFAGELFRGLKVAIRYIEDHVDVDVAHPIVECKLAPHSTASGSLQLARQLATVANIIAGGLIRDGLASDVEVIRRSHPRNVASDLRIVRRRRPIREDLG